MRTRKMSFSFNPAMLFAVLLLLPAGTVFSAVKEDSRLSLGELESFTDRINSLTRSIEEQKLALDQAREKLELVDAEGGEAPEAKALAKEELQSQIRDLEKATQENEKELETYSARIQESHGYAPQLLGSSAISKTAENQP